MSSSQTELVELSDSSAESNDEDTNFAEKESETCQTILYFPFRIV